jgi:hypothetical protein
MKAGEYPRILAEFITGNVRVSQLSQHVEERLFELRRKPEITEERELLSSIELCLHEFDEGYRDLFEVYSHVQSIIDNITLEPSPSKRETDYIKPTVSNVPCSISNSFEDMEPGQPSDNPTITRDVELVPSR